ncbi:MAG: TRAP transporter large permease [Alphaproteobacteria bacterium]|nr:TRAP transporter large permease [Alphaproteobacteria bacterium]
MSWQWMLCLYVAALALLITIGCPIAVALGLAAILGIVVLHGGDLLPTVGDILWNTGNSFTLVAIPMFILMGEIILETGVSRRFYRGLSTLLARAPGGLAHANVLGCAMFSAISGSSVATALTMGKVAMPELRRRGYDLGLTTGSLAAGGTLGILIPPSIPMIIYAVAVQVSIVDLFMAGVIPGIVLTLLFMAWIAIALLRRRDLAPPSGGARIAPAAALAALADIAPLVLLIFATIGSLYFGLVTPTEAGAFGALAALAVGVGYGELTPRGLGGALSRTVVTTSVVFYIIVTGAILAFGIVDAGIARGVTNAVVDAQLSPLQFFLLISLLYILLGMFIEGVSMMLLTVPVLYPSVLALGFDPVWFGVILVVFIELGALTPPMGLNLFAIHSVAGDVPLRTIIRGSFPFALVMLLFLAILYVLPELALWLPATLR